MVPTPIVRARLGTLHAAGEEIRVGSTRLGLQARQVCVRLQAGSGLVEPDVPVRADPEDLQIDAAGARDRRLVAAAFAGRVGLHTVQEMNPLAADVHVPKQVLIHETAVAGWVFRRQAMELVEIERRHAREIQLAGRGEGPQVRVQVYRRSARRKAQHGRRLGGDESCHAKSHGAGHGVVVGEDVYLHGR